MKATIAVPIKAYSQKAADRAETEDTITERTLLPGHRLEVIGPDTDGETLCRTEFGAELYIETSYLLSE